MFSFLHKINHSKSKHSQEQKASLSNMKHKGALCSDSSTNTLEAVDLASPKAASNKLPSSNSGFLTFTLRKHHFHKNNTSGSVDRNHTPDSTGPGKCETSGAKSPFNRKSNLSLASFNSGYFTTGRFSDRKSKHANSSASLGTIC